MSRPFFSNPMPNEQRLLSQLLGLYERERQLVAYEIHDGFVQKATAALLHLQAFRELHVRNAEEAWRSFEAAERALSQGVDEARRLMAGLRPPALEEAGVVAAIDYLSRESGGREGPKMEFFHAVRFDRLPPLLETTLFRIAQESLANACRHSRSEKVRISLVEVGESVRLEVQDWGIGFNPETVDETRFGLRGIRERARMLGGRVAIETSPCKGTRVTVELPLRPGDEGLGIGVPEAESRGNGS